MLGVVGDIPDLVFQRISVVSLLSRSSRRSIASQLFSGHRPPPAVVHFQAGYFYFRILDLRMECPVSPSESASASPDSPSPDLSISPLSHTAVSNGGILQSNFYRTASSFFGTDLDSRKIVAKKTVFEKDGCPVISFSEDEINKLSAPFSTTLVGKFYNGVPSISRISKSLKGSKHKI